MCSNKNIFLILCLLMSNELTDSNHLCLDTSSSRPRLFLDADFETAWLSRDALSDFYGVSTKALTAYLATALKGVDKSIHVRRVHFVSGKIGYESQYSLTVIIKLAFLIDSEQAGFFREWMSATLERVLTKGFFVDKDRIKGRDARQDFFLKQVHKHFSPER